MARQDSFSQSHNSIQFIHERYFSGTNVLLIIHFPFAFTQ